MTQPPGTVAYDVSHTVVFIRSSPSLSSMKLGYFRQGAQVYCIQQEGAWIKLHRASMIRALGQASKVHQPDEGWMCTSHQDFGTLMKPLDLLLPPPSLFFLATRAVVIDVPTTVPLHQPGEFTMTIECEKNIEEVVVAAGERKRVLLLHDGEQCSVQLRLHLKGPVHAASKVLAIVPRNIEERRDGHAYRPQEDPFGSKRQRHPEEDYACPFYFWTPAESMGDAPPLSATGPDQFFCGDCARLIEEHPKEMHIEKVPPQSRENADSFDPDGVYAALGVDYKATANEIKQAYRELAKDWHPDRNFHRLEEATNIMSMVAGAYEVLSDPDLRDAYDSNAKIVKRRQMGMRLQRQ